MFHTVPTYLMVNFNILDTSWYILIPCNQDLKKKNIFFCQGFSEDLPHHTARIFAQARVASWAWHEMTKLSLNIKIRLYKMSETTRKRLVLVSPLCPLVATDSSTRCPSPVSTGPATHLHTLQDSQTIGGKGGKACVSADADWARGNGCTMRMGFCCDTSVRTDAFGGTNLSFGTRM